MSPKGLLRLSHFSTYAYAEKNQEKHPPAGWQIDFNPPTTPRGSPIGVKESS